MMKDSKFTPIATAASRNASSDDVALMALSRKAAAWQKLGGKPSEDDVLTEALCMAEREIIGLRAAIFEIFEGDKRLLRDLESALVSASLRPTDAVDRVRAIIEILRNTIDSHAAPPAILTKAGQP